MKRILDHFTWSEWRNLKIFYSNVEYCGYLIQFKINNNGLIKFRQVKIYGGGGKYANMIPIEVHELKPPIKIDESE